ncbi:V-type ATPase subunit [bacterium]|nr:V-type ATPase subunit [bacterium]
MVKIEFHNMHDDTRYSFAVGKIRALESKMLDNGLIMRMLKSSGMEEMLKILGDTEYGAGMNESADVSFESILDNELRRIYEFVHKIDPDPMWTDIWRWRYDAHNIKVILKAGFSNKDAMVHLIPLGMVDPQDLVSWLQEGDYSFLPPSFKEAVEMALSFDEKGEKSGQEIDFIIDRALYLYLSLEAENSKNPFVRHLVEIMVDFINIKAFLRTSGKGMAKGLFERSFLPGGYIKEEAFLDQGEKRHDETVRSILGNMRYEELIPALGSGNVALLEAAMESFLITYIRQTRRRAFGVEPLIGYILAKEIEIQNLRLIYIGKANALEEGLIKERLRDAYV